MRWLDGITVSVATNLGKLWEMLRDRLAGVLQSMGSQRVKQETWQQNNNNLRYILAQNLKLNLIRS